MSRIAYVNGLYVPRSEAMVHIEDRGYQFADGIYEVAVVVDGRAFDFDGHYERYERSLRELRMARPVNKAAMNVIMVELLRRNRLKSALVYMQVTRGVAPRNHAFPHDDVPPSLVMTARRFDIHASDLEAQVGISVITQPDIRWGRVDIKTTGLLPNALAKQAAAEAGAYEAMLVRDGVVTECSASNVWIVGEGGVLVTHPKCERILGGITRETTIKCAEELQIKVEERPFTVEEAIAAAEVFVTSATSFIKPVIAIDGAAIGGGKPGPVALKLRDIYKGRVLGH